ncbi:hypothetical protein RirG_067520 [Rhizophagus irregularis DAOM 197198w]|uniref:MACPF domain-containing protein n=2 Tax=Rhizophagus irregularis TaxID=588596 RepID=A0A015JZ67_RHIIW|nr:hypothetical protein RirG_067520 [Rhizophagus irregularis DAOM 197198w]
MSFNLKNIFSSNVKVEVQNLDTKSSQLVDLNLTDNLSKIRKKLENDNDNIINNTLLFSKKREERFIEIPFKKEDEFLLNEIIDKSGNILYLKFCSKPNWKFLNNLRKLEFGCTMTFNGIKKAEKRASIMKNCELAEFDAGGCLNGEVEFNSEQDRFMKTNLFFNINISDVKKFVELGMSIGTSKNEKFKSETNTTCYYTIYKKVTLKFREYLEASPEFVEAVKEAVDFEDARNLQQVTEKFGQFIPTEIIMGGKAYLDGIIMSTKHNEEDHDKVSLNAKASVIKAELTNTYDNSIGISNNYKSKCKNLIGGEQPDSIENFDEKAWIKSLKDYRNWDCIEFQNPVSIFELLPADLRKRVIELVGKRIHHLKFEEFDYKLEEFGRPNIFELKNMPLNISKMIQNKDADCNVFATINDITGSKDDFFTWQVYCPPNSKPSLLIHCIQKKKFKKRRYKLKIGWMVIGYYTDYTDLNFILSDFNAQLKVLKKDFNTLSNPTVFERDLLNFEYNPLIGKFPPCLGIPVLSKLDSSNNSLVIGHHFFNAQEKDKIGACTFSYCVKKGHYVNLPEFTFYILIISNYHISNAFGNQTFEKKKFYTRFRFNLNITKNCLINLNTKYISLYSTEKTNLGPIFLYQKGGEIKLQYIDCKCKACCICKDGLILSEKNIEYAYFDPDIRNS